MKITFFGTRGSVPISNSQSVKTGGNTTCLGIESPCLPRHTALAVDAGSGFIPFSLNALKHDKELNNAHVLHTHWHHDHTQGLPLSPLAFMKQVRVSVWGPTEGGYGPREVYQQIIQPPLFPVSFDRLGAHFSFHKIENPDACVIAFHHNGGVRKLSIEQLERAQGVIKFGDKLGSYPQNECLIVKMHWTNHPERTISYRFEEGSSGKVFVFLTDHENQDRLSLDMRKHLQGADLLVMDSQYTRATYDTKTAGFGHGTPDFCVRTAIEAGAKRLMLTHHDPFSTDVDVATIVEMAREYLLEQGKKTEDLPIEACTDFSVVGLYNDSIPIAV